MQFNEHNKSSLRACMQFHKLLLSSGEEDSKDYSIIEAVV